MAIEAWYMDDSDADQREEHRLNPNQPVSLEELAKVGGFGLDDRLMGGGRRDSMLAGAVVDAGGAA